MSQTSKVINATEETFEQVIANDKLVIIDFYASWCAPCKMISPILDVLSQRDDVVIVKVDVDSLVNITKRYGVRGVPTLLFIKDGTVVQTKVGAIAKSAIEAIIETNSTN